MQHEPRFDDRGCTMTLREAEELMYEDYEDWPEAVIEEGADYAILLEGPWIRVPDLELYLREGIFYNIQDSGEYMADFGITSIFWMKEKCQTRMSGTIGNRTAW